MNDGSEISVGLPFTVYECTRGSTGSTLVFSRICALVTALSTSNWRKGQDMFSDFQSHVVGNGRRDTPSLSE